MVVCPACWKDVTTIRGPDGARTCPDCGWAPHGQAPSRAAGGTAPSGDLGAHPEEIPDASDVWEVVIDEKANRAPGAKASVVLGILGVCSLIGGIVLGPIAIVMAVRARRRIRKSEGALSGNNLTVVGLATGILAVLIVVPVVVFAFFLVSLFAADSEIRDVSTVIGPDESITHAFILFETADVRYEVDGHGEEVVTAILRVDDAGDPDPIWGTEVAQEQGLTTAGSAVLEPGDYGLYIECSRRAPCSVTYSVFWE